MNSGWCGSRSSHSYLTLDLRKEYHITKVVIMGDKEQSKWSESYSLQYSRDKTYGYKKTVVSKTFSL